MKVIETIVLSRLTLTKESYWPVTVIFIVLLGIFFTVATLRQSTLTKQRLQTRRHCNYM